MIHRDLVLCCPSPKKQVWSRQSCALLQKLQSECVLRLVTVMRVECKATPDYDKVYFWSKKSVPFRMTGNFHVDILFSVSNLQLLFQHSNSLLPPKKLNVVAPLVGYVSLTN